MHYLALFGGVLGLSMSAIFARYSSAPSMVMAFYRFFFAAVMLLPANFLLQRRKPNRITPACRLLCAADGLAIATHLTLYLISLEYTSIASSLVLIHMDMFFVPLISRVLWHERISMRTKLGMAITFAGSLIIGIADAGQPGSSALKGDLIALAGSVFISIDILLAKQIRKTATTVQLSSYAYLTGAAVIFLILKCGGTQVFQYGMKNIGLGFGMAICCTILGLCVFSWCVKFIKPVFVSVVKQLETVFSTLLGILLFQEIPPAGVMIGGLVMIAGVIICSTNMEKTEIEA